MKNTFLSALALALVSGCSGDIDTPNVAWTQANDAMHSLGIGYYSVAPDASREQLWVLLADDQKARIGRLEVRTDAASTTIGLDWRGEPWSATVAPSGEMDLTFRGQTAHLVTTNNEIDGDAAALALYAASKPQVDVVKAVGEGAQLARILNPDTTARPETNSTEPYGGCGLLFVGFGRCAWWDENCACNQAYGDVERLCRSYSGVSCCWLSSYCTCRHFGFFFTDCWLDGKAWD
jgi:hypothetical protein